MACKIFQQTIKDTERAVRLKTELGVANEALARWKRVQESQIYERAGPATRQYLDQERMNYAHAAGTLEKKLKKTLTDIEDGGCSSSETEDKGLEAYMNELEGWAGSLRHLIAARPLPGTEVPTKWTWAQIEAAVVVMDELSENLMTRLFMKCYTNEFEVDDRTSVSRELEAIVKDMLDEPSRQWEPVGNLHDLKAVLVAHVSRNEAELVQLQVKLTELNIAQDQMQRQLEKYTSWAEEDTARKNELSLRLRTLQRLPNPTTSPTDEIIELMKQLMEDEIENASASISIRAQTDNVTKSSLESNEALLKELQVKLQPTVELTKSIMERASSRHNC
ncbi:hypothetical protein DXG01_010945 [Tephrocybe rancida]|nr:hypothetical protein DXG01_010945 [Tephrocybe rancida]